MFEGSEDNKDTCKLLFKVIACRQLAYDTATANSGCCSGAVAAHTHNIYPSLLLSNLKESRLVSIVV